MWSRHDKSFSFNRCNNIKIILEIFLPAIAIISSMKFLDPSGSEFCEVC